DCVNVVGVVLNVVVFDQKRRALDSIIVRLTLFEPSGPREINVPQSRGSNPVHSCSGDIRRVPRSIFVQKRHLDLLLLLTQLVGLKTGRLELFCFSEIGGQNIGWGALAHNRLGALPVIERFDQLPGKVLFGGKRAQPLEWTLQDFGRIRAEERGGRRDVLALDEREVQRNVVTFDSPTPGLVGPCIAEDAEEIKFRIADRPAAFLHFAENRVEAHYRRSCYQPALTKTCAHKSVTQETLRGVEFLEWNPFACSGNEVPVEA